MSDQPVSVQLYSVREAIGSDLPGTLERVAGLGFTQVELFDFVDRSGEYAMALPAAGLTAPSAHAALLSGPDPRRTFETAAGLGVGTVIDPWFEPATWTDADEVRRTAERLTALAAEAAEFGLAVGYHNHWFEIEARHDGQTALELLAANLGPDVRLEVDAFWAMVGGASASELIHGLGDRVRFVHAKDGPNTRDTDQQQPAGQGAVDIAAVLAAAPQAQPIVEFDDYAGDIFDGLAQSLAFVRDHS